MMQTIRVRLKSFTPIPDSSNYRYMISYPPSDIEFVGFRNKSVISKPNIFKKWSILKKSARSIIEVTKLPNLIFSIKKDADIFHCSHSLLLNNFPWVTDFEHYWTFSVSAKISYSTTGKKIINNFLKKKNCKKILPWTISAKESLEQVIKNKEILDKCEVVYPAVPFFQKKKSNNKIPSLLFVGRYFYEKGGLFFVKVVEDLQKKYDVDAKLVSFTVPESIIEKYGSKIKIFKQVPNEVLFNKIYPEADVFIYPGFTDTFGFSLLEAMSFGIPIITTNAFAREEIVTNNNNGFIVNRPDKINFFKIDRKENNLVNNLVRKTALLIENLSTRKKMSKENRKLIKNGKFSIKNRNKKLRIIYEEATKQ